MSGRIASKLIMNLFLDNIFLLYQMWLVHSGKVLIMTVILRGWMGFRGWGVTSLNSESFRRGHPAAAAV
jgi:hypothetical protein